MKHLKLITSWTIWTVVALYVLLLTLTHLPLVQARMGSGIASLLSQKLGTQVHVGRVELGFLNRLIIDDIQLCDLDGAELLRANRLSAKIDVLPLFEQRIRISSAQLFGAQLCLRRATADAPTNAQFVIDALQSDEPSTSAGIDLRIGSLIVRHSSVSYDQADAPETPGLLNTAHLHFSNISSHIVLKTLTPDSLNANIKRLAFNEQSGLRVTHLNLKAEAGQHGARLSNFNMQLPASAFALATITADYDADRLPATLRFDGSLLPSVATPSDFSFLLPELQQFDTPLQLSLRFDGTGESLQADDIDIRADNGSMALLAQASLRKYNGQTTWTAEAQKLLLSADFMAHLKAAFNALPNHLLRIGDLTLTARAEHNADGHTTAQADVHTAIGQMALQMGTTDNQHFDAELQTDSLHLGKLLANDDLGLLAGSVNLSGNSRKASIKGTLQRVDYKDYAYHDIDLDVDWQGNNIAGKLKIADPNIQTDVEGVLRRGKRSAVRLTGYISNLSPQALHLSEQWGAARFSAVVDADFVASSPDDAEGSIDIDDFIMAGEEGEAPLLHIDNIHVKSGYADDGTHFMRLLGDFGEMRLEGNFNWGTLPQSFINYTASKLPTLPGLPETLKQADNNFEVSIRLSDATWLEQLFGVPLTLEKPLRLQASVNDLSRAIDIDGQLPAFSYNGARYADGHLQLTTTGDTARTDLQIVKAGNDSRHTRLSLKAMAADNQLQSTLTWNSEASSTATDNAMSGEINAVAELYTNELSKPEAHIRLRPSHAIIKGAEWTMESTDVLYSEKRLLVDHFNLRHADQHLIVDGIASDQPSDSLLIDLSHIDVAYVLDLVNFHAVDFGGQLSGKAYATQLFADFDATADIEVEQFTFMDGHLGTLTARAEWNQDEKQIDIEAFADDGADAQTFVDGFVAPTRDDIDLLIRGRGTNAEFVNTFADSFLENIEARAYGDVRLIGPLSSVNLTGELAVEGQATVTALNTTYQLRGDTVFFVPNDIQFRRHRIYDRNGHMGYVSGALHHSNFSNFTFDLDVDADNLLVYDFPNFDDGIVCGTVYANGQADLHGLPGEITINCNVTPRRGSTFAYNAANPDAISNQQFITWREVKGTQASLSPTQDGNKDWSAFNTIMPGEKGEGVPEVSWVAESAGKDGTSVTSETSDIYINFIINATPDATLRVLMDQNTGDYITLNGNGALRASFYNKGPFQMFGTYAVERGTYGITIQNIIRKNFVFQNGGTIVFGGDPYDAQLNMQAQYTVNGVSLSDLQLGNSFNSNTIRVNCLMNIGGTPGSPRVDFDLEMPTVNSEEQQMIRSIIASEQELNQQVVYLLGIGRFYTQTANNAGTQEYGQTELAMQSLLSGTVSSQINELLSQVIKNDEWNFGANISTGNEGWHNAEYEGMVSGRMLNNRLLINGQFGYRDNATQASPSFIGDFDIQYLLFPNGNLALKVYNQTNDRYFTRSSLNTQGIGLIMKKDFNGLKDLLTPRRKKNKSSK